MRATRACALPLGADNRQVLFEHAHVIPPDPQGPAAHDRARAVAGEFRHVFGRNVLQWAFLRHLLAHARQTLESNGAQCGLLDTLADNVTPRPRMMQTASSCRPGRQSPAPCVASGLVQLAFQPPAEQERLLLRGPAPCVNGPGLSPDQVRTHLEEIRARGYVLDDNFVPGLRAAAAPVRDATGYAIASITVSASRTNCRWSA